MGFIVKRKNISRSIRRAWLFWNDLWKKFGKFFFLGLCNLILYNANYSYNFKDYNICRKPILNNFILPKKVSELQKKEILDSFVSGIDLKELSEKYKFSHATIVKQLKIKLGLNKFNELKNRNNKLKKEKNMIAEDNLSTDNNLDQSIEIDPFEDKFVEVIPITDGIELNNQKDLASEPLKKVKFPDVVYMLVDKNIELLPKSLKDYPEWSFLPQDDLSRMSLEIYDDHNFAKKLCSKNQKLIKVPNPNVFLMASNSLKSKGITRIIFNNRLLSF